MGSGNVNDEHHRMNILIHCSLHMQNVPHSDGHKLQCAGKTSEIMQISNTVHGCFMGNSANPEEDHWNPKTASKPLTRKPESGRSSP